MRESAKIIVKELLKMTNLIPFKGKNTNLSTQGFGNIFNMIDDFFTDDFPVRRSLSHDTFKIDVREEDKNYLVEAELPGVNKEDITISVEDGMLTIAVKHEEQKEQKEKNYIHRERRFSSMERRLMLGDADGTGISAKLNDGLLEIKIPKKEKQDTSKKIEIE